VRRFSVRPPLTMTGRTFKGLRGWSGKPLHPPLTDLPIAAYVLAAAFDVISAIAARTTPGLGSCGTPARTCSSVGPRCRCSPR